MCKRLKGAILIAPAISSWWPLLPEDLVKEAFEKKEPWMQWNLLMEYTKQRVYESVVRDYMVGFGEWEFEPLQLENPFPGIDGAVQLWQGGADEAVSVVLQRYMADRLPWIQYHEVPNVGHKFALEDGVKYQIFMSMIRGLIV
ncbi:hydrolase [Lithospermum erythrorhizon]|uniref:Hydrolase n=1 Tax=Lithospermum erythrorhizon TaxID=34254 RepID=A0AAV3Q939_LITER